MEFALSPAVRNSEDDDQDCPTPQVGTTPKTDCEVTSVHSPMICSLVLVRVKARPTEAECRAAIGTVKFNITVRR